MLEMGWNEVTRMDSPRTSTKNTGMSAGHENYLHEIAQAVELVVGPKTITPQSYLRRDLDVQSLELAEIFFQLRRITGLDGLAEILFAAAHSEDAPMDIQVSGLQEALQAKKAALSGRN